MASLLELSHELLHCIFTEIDPADVSSLCKTCPTLNSYVRGNRLLHKDLHLRRYDKPITADEPDWEDELQKAVKLEKILSSADRDVKRQHFEFVADEINHLLETASVDPAESLNVELLSDYFYQDEENGEESEEVGVQKANLDTFMCSSSLFTRGGTTEQRPAPTPKLQQASAKLHCLYGKPIDPVPSTRCSSSYAASPFLFLRHIDLTTSPSANTRQQSRGIPVHTVARSKVYDLREYTDNTLWGPFMNDGSQNVDWEKVEAVMVVLGFNLSKFIGRTDGHFPKVWNTPFVGATPKSYISPPPTAGPTKELDGEISVIRELAPSIDSLDPYGVTGTWMRVVCFLDYNDLYAFNFSSRIGHHESREPIDTEEGIIDLEEFLQVTRIEAPGSADDDEEEDGMDWSDFCGERLPIVHFRGSSRSLHASWDPNANSRIRGTVRQTPEGEIRWTSFSIFHGEERWRSEGIQVGGLRSARGVLGNWFDKDYDIHGPAGPTAFWKETDELEEERSSSMPIAFF